jgi:uncharacterized protein YutE (UPF0331/DUF86 family)
VLQKNTAKQLEEYLGFRHVVRNLYTWELDTTKVERLIKHLPHTLQAVENDLETFGHFLDAASHADEQV